MSPAAKARLFCGDGQCSDLINAMDWSATPVGPMASWPASLRTIVATMLQSRHPMFLWWGPDLIQFYNDAYVPSFGMGKHPTAMGQRGHECWGEIWPIISPQIDDVMSRGKASWNEDHLVPILRNGRIEEVYWTYGYSPVCDEQGRIAGTLVVCNETTARVVAERRLKIIRHLADATSPCDSVDAIADAGLDVARASPFDIPFALMYRRDPETHEYVLQSSVRVDAPELETLDAAVRAALRGHACDSAARASMMRLPEGLLVPGGPWPEAPREAFVITPKTPGASTFILGTSPRLPFDSAYRHFFTDFVEQLELSSARVEAFRARAAVESERRNVLLQAPIATALLTGPQHVFELANPAYVRLVGGRQVLGKAFVDAFPEVRGTSISEVIERVYRTGEPFVAEEYRVPLDRRGDGTLDECFFKFNLEPLRDGGGAVYGMMVVAVEITDQVEARRSLERTNAERQRLLAQLEASSHAKDEFLATVSHELRTPLNAMLGWASLLRTTEMSPEKRDRALATIERNARAQAQLIEDLLDVSRIISGNLRLELHALDLATIIEAAIETVRPAADSKGVRIQLLLAGDARHATGDPHRLQQVVWNLVSNAVKFTDQGGVVTVRLRRAPGHSHTEIVVSDTGQGIAGDFLPHMFERFKQANGTTTRSHGGLGIGLAIVKHLVELHGGTVLAESDGVKQGSTFTVRLPLSELLLPVARDDVSVGSSLAFAAPRLDGLHVLVVDDELDARTLLVAVLEGHGARVTAVSSVLDALREIEDRRPDVLVSDIGMPEEDGYSLIRRLRSSAKQNARPIPAAALTAYAGTEDRRRAMLAGFQQHLSKPVEPAELLIVVAALAGRNTASESVLG